LEPHVVTKGQASDVLVVLEVDVLVLVLVVLEVLEEVDVLVDVVLEVLVVELVLVELLVVVVVAHGQIGGTVVQAAKPEATFALYFVAVSLFGSGAAKRVQNVSVEAPNTTWTSTSPCGAASSPYVMPPFVLNFILPAETWALLLVRTSFHLYFVGVPLDGAGVHPGVTVGAGANVRH
jgi:hypothetical protein